jgi:hypothetical protein
MESTSAGAGSFLFCQARIKSGQASMTSKLRVAKFAISICTAGHSAFIGEEQQKPPHELIKYIV